MNSASGSLDAMEGIWDLKYEPQHLKKAGQDGASGRACPQPNHSHSVYKRANVVLALESRAQVQQPQNGGHSHPGSKGAKKARLPFQ